MTLCFQGFVYWSEEVTRSVCRANKHNGTQLKVLRADVTSPGGVVIVQPVLQPNGTTNQKQIVFTIDFTRSLLEKHTSQPQSPVSLFRAFGVWTYRDDVSAHVCCQPAVWEARVQLRSPWDWTKWVSRYRPHGACFNSVWPNLRRNPLSYR